MTASEEIVSVTRDGRTFFVDLSPGDFLSASLAEEYRQFWTSRFPGDWETDTFRCLDEYLRADALYLDIGAWVGPTVLYAANRCARVVCLEPDPVAHAALQRNIAVNPSLGNISVINAALGSDDGQVLIGGNGDLGNSESTILVEDRSYVGKQPVLSRKSTPGKNRDWRAGPTTTARMISPRTLFERYRNDTIALVKMDIEGGEKIALPPLIEFLHHYQPVLLISLHWVYLDHAEVSGVVDHIFGAYTRVLDAQSRLPVDQASISERHVNQLLCIPGNAPND